MDASAAPAPASFGAYVRKKRKALDLTQEELAQCVGCSASAIRKIESDHRRPSKQIAELLATCLKIPPEEQEMFIKVARFERGPENLSLPGLDEARQAAPPPSPHTSPAVLPAPLTPLVGREPELSQLIRLLLQHGCQLVTLLGPSGIGKTRLALQTARHFIEDPSSPFIDGVFFVSLSTIETPELVLPAITSAMDFQPHGPGDQRTRFLSYLRSKQMLVILDNVEHLLSGTELLVDILQWAPEVKILTTSKERLNLHGEWIFEIQGLPVPPLGQVAGLEHYSSVALFLQNARRARPDFAPDLTHDPQSARDIIRICRAVAGMPLGLELAAAWVRILSLKEIAEEIERNLDFLATTARNIPERHRSLRAAFNHSWKLLNESERRAMQQLSVFRGGFRREAAERVAGASPAALLSLVDKSMLVRGGDGRYEIHELIRQFAGSHLAHDSQELASVQDRHMEYFIHFIAARRTALKSGRQKEALEELSAELDNLRLAWNRAIDTAHIPCLQNAAQPLMLFLELRNSFREGEAIFQRAAEMLEALKPLTKEPPGPGLGMEQEIILGILLANQAWFSYRSGRTEQALALFRYALSMLRKHKVKEPLADALWYHTSACWFAGEYEEANQSIQEGLEIYRQVGQNWGIANLTVYQGIFAYERGDVSEAHRLLQEGLSLGRETGDPRLISFAAIFLSRTPQAIEQYAGTQDLLQEVLQLAKDTGDRYSQGVALERLALLACANGDCLKAEALMQESIRLFQEIGDQWSLSRVLNHIGQIRLSQGEAAAAQDAFMEAFTTAEEARVLPNALTAMAGLARIQADRGEAEAALELAFLVLHHPASPMDAMETAGKLQQELEKKIPPERAAQLRVMGETKSFDQMARAIRYTENRTVGW